MISLNKIFRIGIAFLVISMMFAQSQSSALGASSGFAPSKISEDSEVTFSATLYNFLSISIYVQALFIEFIEGKISGSTGNANRYNISKVYPSTRQEVVSNSSFSDTFKTFVTFNPGIYNVSIFFTTGNSSAASTFNPNAYALINQTIQITGVSGSFQALQIFIFAFIGILIVVFILYRRFK